MPTKNRHNSLAKAGARRRRKEKEAAGHTSVSIAANFDNCLIDILLRKLVRNGDHAAVLDEFVRYIDSVTVNQIRIDDGSTFQSVARDIASAWCLPSRPASRARKDILMHLGNMDILIVRDLHRLAGSGEREQMVVEFLREIHDATGCSLVLEYAPTYRLDEQFSRRIGFTVPAK